MYPNGIQKNDGENTRAMQMTIVFVVSGKPKSRKGNGPRRHPDGEITCGSLPIVGGRIGLLRAFQR